MEGREGREDSFDARGGRGGVRRRGGGEGRLGVRERVMGW
jgi:hypothetical protein